MMRSAKVFYHNQYAGIVSETERGYAFVYDSAYLTSHDAQSVSKTLPKSQIPLESNYLFPFFDGLIPEGWLLDIAEQNWKLDPRDRFGLLMACCKNCIGAVSVRPDDE